MKKKLYIHIGRPKAGSSAIQKFLTTNHDLLIESGCLYPDTGSYQNASHKMSLVFLPNLPDAHIVSEINAADLYQQLIDEIASSTADKAIISSEHFWFVDPDKIPDNLAELFDVKIICYVRRQDEVVLSSFSQEVKRGMVSIKTSYKDYMDHPARLSLLDYAKILKRWELKYGRDNIIVRVNEKQQMPGGIYVDLLNAIGISINDKYIIPERRVNVSPARDILDYIELINKYAVPGDGHRGLMLQLLKISENIGSEGKYDSKNLLDSIEKKEILDQFEESNSFVARHYLGRTDGKLFYAPIEDALSTDVAYKGIELDRFLEISAALFLYQQKEIMRLHKKLDNHEARLNSLKHIDSDPDTDKNKQASR